jgi:erythrocyte band 7 integral membrane protein
MVNLDKWELDGEDESKMLLRRGDESLNFKFQDPQLLSSKATTENLACYECCGGFCMYACCPCNLLCN